jgi:hypothetical protein
MATQNAQILNAALAAFLAGAVQSQITDTTDADYAAVCDAALAFATQVDSEIPTDGGIVTPLTAAGQKKVCLLQSICIGVMSGRTPTSTTAADYAGVASAIAALYREGVTKLV